MDKLALDLRRLLFLAVAPVADLRWGRVLIAMTALLLHAAPVHAEDSTNARGRALHRELVTALDHAVSVKILEHTNAADAPFAHNYHERIFATVSLTTAQIEKFEQAIPPAFASSDRYDCIFDDHHRILITGTDGQVLTLNLCFVCGELQINDDETQILPNGWGASLKHFLSSLHLHPDGPWDKGPLDPKKGT